MRRPWLGLTAEHFDRWQPRLLDLLNEPRLRQWARKRMGLHPHVRSDEEILALSPHHVVVPVYGRQYRGADARKGMFFSQPAIQRSLYRAFAPVLWAMHGWDWLLPDRMSERWV